MSIKDLFKHASTKGVYLPVAHDKGVPSVTLWFLYLANILAIGSLVWLHFKADAVVASTITIIYAVIQTVFYLMRRIKTFKADLDDQSIELEGDNEENNP